MSLLSAATMESYSRAYPFLTRLHILQEIEEGSQLIGSLSGWSARDGSNIDGQDGYNGSDNNTNKNHSNTSNSSNSNYGNNGKNNTNNTNSLSTLTANMMSEYHRYDTDNMDVQRIIEYKEKSELLKVSPRSTSSIVTVTTEGQIL